MSILLVVDPWITRLLDFIKGDALTDMIEIMSSCGGLILCCCHKQRIREYYVCNPSTNQFSIVPSSGGARHFMNGLHTEINSWRRLQDPFPMSILSELRGTTGVFFNGATIFWVFNSWCYFNVDTETLRYLDNPMQEMNTTYPYTDYWLGCVNERLYFVGPADDGWIPHVSVFELGNEYLWILKYRNDPL
nr:uncharacterized protein LOC104647346 [Solanum lycopersicum]XP_019069312.1 uncharacterized protein LOC104647346 [Solanum lycopersicum]XP_025886916.1 uncharacterized protein LOC104647346 [Solanum lycopersicum]